MPVCLYLFVQKIGKTPSAVPEAPACPVSTGTRRRQSQLCTSWSPLPERTTLLFPPASGSEQASEWS